MSIILSESDKLLLQRRFTVADPKNLPNLVLKVPNEKAAAEMEFEYDVQPFVKCADCGQPHGKGFVMKMPDGSRFLIGKDCGLKIYGLDFYQIEQTFKHGRSRQYDLYRVMNCLPLLRPLGAALYRLADDARCRKLAQVQHDLLREMPYLYKLLKAAADRKDHELVVFEVIADEAASRLRAESNNAARAEIEAMTVTEYKRRRKAGLLPRIVDESEPVTRRVQKGLLVLRGITLFRKPVVGRIDHIFDCGRLAHAMHDALDGSRSEDLSSTRLSDACRKIHGFIEKVENIHDDLRDCVAFFEQDHLVKIAEWATNTPDCQGDYEAIEAGLIFNIRGGDSDPAVVGLPKEFRLPGLECLDPLRSELTIQLLAAA